MHLGTVAAKLLSEAIQQNIEHSIDWVKSYNEFRWAKYFKQQHDNKLGSLFFLITKPKGSCYLLPNNLIIVFFFLEM